MHFHELWSRTVVVAFALLWFSEPSVGQRRAEMDSVPHQCRLAIQVLSTGHPANKREWALGYVPACGAQGGAALAHEVATLRTTTSRTAEAEQLIAAAAGLQDASVYGAALQLATDSNAAPVGRVQAIRILLAQLSGAVQSYDDTVTDGTLASAGYTEGPAVGVPLPPGYEGETARLLFVVAARSPAGPVQAAARNVARQARAADRLHRFCPRGTAAADCIARLNADTTF